MRSKVGLTISVNYWIVLVFFENKEKRLYPKTFSFILARDPWNSRKGDNSLGFLLIKLWDGLCLVGHLFVFLMLDGINCEVRKNIGLYFPLTFLAAIIVTLSYAQAFECYKSLLFE